MTYRIKSWDEVRQMRFGSDEYYYGIDKQEFIDKLEHTLVIDLEPTTLNDGIESVYTQRYWVPMDAMEAVMNADALRKQYKELDKQKDDLECDMDFIRRQLDVLSHVFEAGHVIRYETGAGYVDFMTMNENDLATLPHMKTGISFSGLIVHSTDEFWEVGTLIHFETSDSEMRQMSMPVYHIGTVYND